MDGFSDFSIERILSPQLGRSQPVPDRSVCWAKAPCWTAALVPVQFLGCLQYRVGFCPCAAAFRAHLAPNLPAGSEPQPGPGSAEPLHACCSTAAFGSASAHMGGQQGPVQNRQKVRMRTVFTDSQSRQLEDLFELSDYPPNRARTELARNTGLSEETVRVWFKNRRARRKRQRRGSKVRSPRPSPDRKSYSHAP